MDHQSQSYQIDNRLIRLTGLPTNVRFVSELLMDSPSVMSKTISKSAIQGRQFVGWTMSSVIPHKGFRKKKEMIYQTQTHTHAHTHKTLDDWGVASLHSFRQKSARVPIRRQSSRYDASLKICFRSSLSKWIIAMKSLNYVIITGTTLNFWNSESKPLPRNTVRRFWKISSERQLLISLRYEIRAACYLGGQNFCAKYLYTNFKISGFDLGAPS